MIPVIWERVWRPISTTMRMMRPREEEVGEQRPTAASSSG